MVILLTVNQSFTTSATLVRSEAAACAEHVILLKGSDKKKIAR